MNVIPEDGAAEKLGLILASDDYPDVFLSVGISDANITKYGIEEKLFLPLNDLIEKHGNNIKLFEAFPGTRGRMRPSWTARSAPAGCQHLLPLWPAPEILDQQRRWLNKLGLEKPTTTEEFYNVLVAFRDNDPNGNGGRTSCP